MRVILVCQCCHWVLYDDETSNSREVMAKYYDQDNKNEDVQRKEQLEP